MTPDLSVVVSTVGRPAELARLVASVLAGRDLPEVELVLVDQSRDQACARWLRDLDPPLRWTTTTSAPGASVGRNVGAALSTGRLLCFPDDDCWYDEDTLAQVCGRLRAEPGLSCLSAVQRTPDGRASMLRWLPGAAPVTRGNFYRTTISSTLFVRREAWEAVGPLDEGIGTGSAGRVQAGEESDLVLRMLARGLRVSYDPGVVVRQDDPRDLLDDAFVAKMRGYGAGQGHLWRRHRLPVPRLLLLSVRKVVGSVLRAGSGRPVHARADLAFLAGTFAGYRAGGQAPGAPGTGGIEGARGTGGIEGARGTADTPHVPGPRAPAEGTS